ncbi:MAG: DUF4388 domain-containing protein [Ktedonobacteraceae bacterium]
MQQQPATLTDRLANVIEVIQLGRKTGILTAERDTGSMLEHGMITFVKGQVTQTSVGQHTGFPAFKVLKTWGTCRFAFTPSDTSQITQQTTQPLSPITGEASTQRGFVTDPTLRIPATGKQNGVMAAGMNSVRSMHSGPAAGGVPSPIRPYNEALVWIERVGLSRAHRRLFLLIDGYRTIPELVRLMGRGEDEVNALLRDLEGANLIRQA